MRKMCLTVELCAGLAALVSWCTYVCRWWMQRRQLDLMLSMAEKWRPNVLCQKGY